MKDFKNITFTHCFGHSVTEGNNRADKLANIAMDEASKRVQYERNESCACVS